MDQTLRAIVRLIEEGKPELQIAATQVLGELKPSDPLVAKALAARLSSDAAYLAPFVLEALARIGTQEALRILVHKLQVGGAIAERAGALLAQMGPPVTAELAPLFDIGDHDLQARVLAILGRHNDREALTILRKALLHPDPQMSERAAAVLRGHLPELPEKQRLFLLEGIEKALTANGSVVPTAAAQALSVLGSTDQGKSRATLLRFIGPRSPAIVRQAALRALAGTALTPAQARQVLACVSEDDMTHVVRPAMHVLEGVEGWDPAAIDLLEPMLDAADEERRLFALRALRGWHTERMAKACLRVLLHDGPEFQEAATQALRGNRAAVAGLLRALSLEKSLERAQRIGRALGALGAHVDDSGRKGMLDKACRLLAAGEPLGDVYLQVVLELDPGSGARALTEKATRLRRAGKLVDGIAILARLAQADRIDVEGRYQLAVARLLADAQSGRSQKRDGGDATMGWFSLLVRDGFPLLERLKKESQLGADDLLRLGRHFATGVGGERRFAAEVLHFLASKHGQKRVGEEARLMLRAEGL